MNKPHLAILILLSFSAFLFSQEESDKWEGRNFATSIGIGHGASLMGVDFEYLVADNVGLQAGFGFLGADATLKFHTEDKINSPSIGITYQNNGFVMHSLGVLYEYRAPKAFSAGIGLGYIFAKPSEISATINILFSIGAYF